MELSKLNIQPLRPEYQNELGFELVMAKTQNNGIDEIFFEHQGTKYVAYHADNADIEGIENARHGLSWQGEPVQFLHSDDEHNHWKEKTWNTLGNIATEGIPDGLGGAAGAALVIKAGLKKDFVKTAAVIGFVTSFVKTAVSTTLEDSRHYQKPDWNNLNRFATLSSSPSSIALSPATQPVVSGRQTSAQPVAALGSIQTLAQGQTMGTQSTAIVISRAGLRGTLGTVGN